jgi:hypothetical protein
MVFSYFVNAWVSGGLRCKQFIPAATNRISQFALPSFAYYFRDETILFWLSNFILNKKRTPIAMVLFY